MNPYLILLKIKSFRCIFEQIPQSKNFNTFNNREHISDGFLAPELVEVLVVPESVAVGKRIIDMQFSKSAVIPMIKRDKKKFTPSGATVIEANDVLMILSTNEGSLARVNKVLS